MAPVTGPERSGRAATVRLPVTLVPVWASVRSTGTPDAPWPAYPDHVPTTLAVGAFAIAFSSLTAAQPTVATQTSARSPTVVALIMVPSIVGWPELSRGIL